MSTLELGRRWVPILMYHRVVEREPVRDPFRNCVTVSVFERQMRWLRLRGYRTVPLASLEGAQLAPSLPSRPLVITFDDGYRDNYENAWPVLAKYDFRATVFLVSGSVGGYNDFDHAVGGERAPMLSASEIREMHAAGIGFGSHTCSHPPSLVDVDDRTLRLEVSASRTAVEDIVGSAVDYFAYPHGKQDARVERAVADAGYKLACGATGTRFDRFCLHRVPGAASRGPMLEVGSHVGRWKWRLRKTRDAIASTLP
jgi:peptidoglycan/xylan/chitin deacetylase (PgdA/CDA1 family)